MPGTAWNLQYTECVCYLFHAATNMYTRKVPSAEAVSYTHLDVYKRQGVDCSHPHSVHHCCRPYDN